VMVNENLIGVVTLCLVLFFLSGLSISDIFYSIYIVIDAILDKINYMLY
jgi:hypothetical protein